MAREALEADRIRESDKRTHKNDVEKDACGGQVTKLATCHDSTQLHVSPTLLYLVSGVLLVWMLILSCLSVALYVKLTTLELRVATCESRLHLLNAGLRGSANDGRDSVISEPQEHNLPQEVPDSLHHKSGMLHSYKEEQNYSRVKRSAANTPSTPPDSVSGSILTEHPHKRRHRRSSPDLNHWIRTAVHYYADMKGPVQTEKGARGHAVLSRGEPLHLRHGIYFGKGKYFIPKDGIYKYWKPKDWCDIPGISRSACSSRGALASFNERTGETTIRRSGLYFVYSQVLFITFNNAAQRNSYSIFIKSSNSEKRQFMQCFQSVGWVASGMKSDRDNAEYHTCYMGGVTPLQRLDRIYLQNNYANRTVDFREYTSYWGIIKLA